MLYPLLLAAFFASVLLLAATLVLRRRRVAVAASVWFAAYAAFIALGTGPRDLPAYPPRATSPYLLPWRAGDERFVAQGNRSFVSHRDAHEYAWDFVMPIGTPLLAARAGRVVAVETDADGIGLRANALTIEHDD